MNTVLVVDDVGDFRDLLGHALKGAGYSVVTAANGWEALVACDHHPIDAILLDVLMPGMDGVTFLKILRRVGENRVVPVLVISVLAEEDVRKRLADLPISGVVQKGRIEEVVDRLNSLMKERALKRQADRGMATPLRQD